MYVKLKVIKNIINTLYCQMNFSHLYPLLPHPPFIHTSVPITTDPTDENTFNPFNNSNNFFIMTLYRGVNRLFLVSQYSKNTTLI